MGSWFKKLASGLVNNLLSVSLDLISSDHNVSVQPRSQGFSLKKMGGAVN